MSSFSLLTTTLPRLPLDSFTLPLLPSIRDTEIEKKVYTHSSYHALPRRGGGGGDKFEEEERSSDNEIYEHVGDSLLGCAVTGLIHDLYPNLRPGHVTLLKSHLVSNATLAQLSTHYDLPSRLIAARDAMLNLQHGEKTVANLFEAYVAGVFYSYLKHGKITTVSQQVIPTPPHTCPKGWVLSASPTPASIPDLPEDIAVKTSRGQAIDHLECWLRPLFTPLAAWVLEEIKREHKRLEALTAEKGGESDLDEKAAGASARLNEWFIVKGAGKPEYISTASAGMWAIQCIATDKSGRQWIEEATRPTKAKASTLAAYKICLQMGDLMKR
ncbi:hypothetical protein IAR55_007114 [Kwoniella newhampshirensis]|uniref:RNase III domain-containing protein n=1 Tax=Kwoniella newhampshirensis TaxID=1651941 RepID=A0AAW0YSH7_9TREE